MKRFLINLFIFVLFFNWNTFAQFKRDVYLHDIEYFIPEGNYSFNKQIPLPESVLGFEIGQQHVDWNNVLEYMKALEAASDRVSIKQFGRTNQFRPFIQVTITSGKNRKNLENIRKEHLKLTDTNVSGKPDIEKMPLVVNLMYSIHGNEPSGVNSSLVLAYFFTALEGAEIENLLDNVILVLTPGLNPDGINRFASWVNSSRSFPDVADLSSREFSEPWPSSRTNHYWADCNRDWLMAQHPEGQNALDMYFEWMANVVCDFHEQSGDKTYYFSPGHPKRTHPLTPQLNQNLTSKLTTYCAQALDKIGTLYYSKEGYDDYYYGKGAAYGDIHGSVCILFEQLASRGHLRPTRNHGEMSFASTVRNQAFSGISVVQGALAMKKELLEYQWNYCRSVQEEAKKEPVQGYVFNARGSHAIAYHFIENMKRHRIDVYHLSKKQSVNGNDYNPEDSYVIPVDQQYPSMVKTLMENVTEYADSTFYDISTWTFPHAYNLQYDELGSVSGLLGEKIDQPVFVKGKVNGGKSAIAYLFENTQYYSSVLITELLKRNLIVKVGSKPFTYPDDKKTVRFGHGTLLIPVQSQVLDPDELYNLINRLAEECGVEVYAVKQGLMADYDLGSPSFTPVTLPKVAVITGSGMGIPESGEVWMLLSKRFRISPTLIDYNTLSNVNLDKYNVLVMADGTPTRTLSQTVVDKIVNWVENGGVLIASGSAYAWTNKAKLTDIKTISSSSSKNDSTGYKSYASRLQANVGNAVDGVILNCRLDYTHPLAYGYKQSQIALFKNGTLAFEVSKSPYSSPVSYLKNPYLSGCISSQNLKRIAGTPAVITKMNGKGQVIVFVDDLNFRMYWYGTSKLFMNAVLFGQLL
ncbi:peptidase M14 [Bacteroidia bacterium]|nr:peptidase M14 [Bacteroidia bacterium]